jgi:hypothetical protein
MSDVPAEWFDAADNARNAALRKDANDQIGALFAALAAVAPLIAKAERERCAEMVEAAAASWRLDAKDRVHWAAREECRVSAFTADEIAAAIRALD